MFTMSLFTHEGHQNSYLDQEGDIAYDEPSGGWIDVKDIGVLIEPTRMWSKVDLVKSP